jgi:tripartite-type tricarboxylate transporter receptor subunit TctC
MPPEARAKLIEAIEKAYNSDAYQNFMKERGFGLRWAGPEEATQIVAADDASLGDVMKKAGLAK